MGVPSGTACQISSISWSVTAMQPSVQSRERCKLSSHRQAMNHHITSRSNAQLGGLDAVFGFGIRDMDGLVELAAWIPPIQHIETFWSLVIPFANFRSNRISP